jgi:hypothetical protein
LAKEIHWDSDESLKKFVLAANLHDIAFAKKPQLAMLNTIEDFDSIKAIFTDEDRTFFINHAEMTAKLLEADHSIPVEVVMMVRQHHEISDGTGFPAQADYKRLKPFSCLFIMALDLSNYILRDKDWTFERFLELNKYKYKGPIFNKLVRALVNISEAKTAQGPKRQF